MGDVTVSIFTKSRLTATYQTYQSNVEVYLELYLFRRMPKLIYD